MGRKGRGGGFPELDPFGANDPAWERYEGVSWIRRVAQSRAGRGKPGPRPKGELFSVMVVGALGLGILVGGVWLVLWLIGLAID